MAAAAAAVNAPVAQLCFGTGTTELNLREVGLHCQSVYLGKAGLLPCWSSQLLLLDGMTAGPEARDRPHKGDRWVAG
jgi:hypothetical protein